MISRRRFQIALFVLVSSGISLVTGWAQTAPSAVPSVSIPGLDLVANPEKLTAPTEDPGPRMDFKFAGLPLTETIRRVQEQYHQAASPKYLNVVIGEHLREVAETNMVTLDVKQVTVGELLNLISSASQHSISGYGFQNGAYKQINGQGGFTFAPMTPNSANPTFVLKSDYPDGFKRLDQMQGQPAPPPESRSVAYFPLEPLLERFTVEDITTAMKLGWELTGSTNQPTLKFHEETKLLVVSGNNEQMQVVNQVLQHLATAAKPPARSPKVVPATVPQLGVPVSPAKP